MSPPTPKFLVLFSKIGLLCCAIRAFFFSVFFAFGLVTPPLTAGAAVLAFAFGAFLATTGLVVAGFAAGLAEGLAAGAVAFFAG